MRLKPPRQRIPLEQRIHCSLIPGIIASGGTVTGGGGGVDPNTLALLHFDGANGSTAMVDEVGGNAWTASGDAQLDTAVKVFGASSLLLDGSGDFVTMDAPSLALGAGDYTLEAWIRWTARGGNNFVFSFGAGWGLYTFGNQWAVFDGAVSNVLGPFGGVVSNVFFHAALVRESGSLGLFIGSGGPGSTGFRLGTVGDATNHATAFLRIGAQPSGAGATTGNIDDFRASNVARYSGGSYTVPAAAVN